MPPYPDTAFLSTVSNPNFRFERQAAKSGKSALNWKERACRGHVAG